MEARNEKDRHRGNMCLALFNGNDPNVGKPGGSLSWAGYIVLSEGTCNRA
jgi:hypothetical protein